MLFTTGIYTDCSLLLFSCSYVVYVLISLILSICFVNFASALYGYFDELIFIYGSVVCFSYCCY